MWSALSKTQKIIALVLSVILVMGSGVGIGIGIGVAIRSSDDSFVPVNPTYVFMYNNTEIAALPALEDGGIPSLPQELIPSRQGYVLSAWTISSIDLDNNRVILDAVWVEETETPAIPVNPSYVFIHNDETIATLPALSNGGIPNLPNELIPSRQGYILMGWTIASIDLENNRVILSAIWEQEPQEPTNPEFVFMHNGLAITTLPSLSNGGMPTLPDNLLPVSEGYILVGWEVVSFDLVNNRTVLNSVWIEEPDAPVNPSYVFMYEGSVIATLSALSNGAIPTLPSYLMPERAGYILSGWTVASINLELNQIILSAIWIEEPEEPATPTYPSYVFMHEGSAIVTLPAGANGAIPALPSEFEPIRPNYRLVGWTVLSVDLDNNRINLIAVWEAEPWTQEVNQNGLVWWRTVTTNTLTGVGVEQSDVVLLDFAEQEGITEIYLNQNSLAEVNPYPGVFGPNGINTVVHPTRQFIREAYNRGIRVFLLLGNGGEWTIDPEESHFVRLMHGLLVYQEHQYVEEYERFAGVQMNIEPHQQGASADEPFHANRNLWLQRKIDFVVWTTDTYGEYIDFDWIIPFWWRAPETDIVNYRGEPTLAYRAIMQEASRISVMAFRDTATGMVHVARDILEYAKEIGIEVILMATVEYTGAEEANNTQFLDHGRIEMNRQLGMLLDVVQNQIGNVEISIAIHHVLPWYRLQDGPLE